MTLCRTNNEETIIFKHPVTIIPPFRQPFYIKKWYNKYGNIANGTAVTKYSNTSVNFEKNYFFKYVYGDYVNPPCIICKTNIVNVDKCQLTHIQSPLLGGNNDKENIIPTCFTCYAKCSDKHIQDFIVENELDSSLIVFDNVHMKKYAGIDGLQKIKCCFCEMYEDKQNIFLFKQFIKEKTGNYKYGFYFKCINCISYKQTIKFKLMNDEELKNYCKQNVTQDNQYKINKAIDQL